MATVRTANKHVLSSAIAAIGILLTCCTAQASVLSGQVMRPMIVAGAPPDSPGARVDANTAASPFSGVVSIQIIAGSDAYICSGALVGARSVISAGHCVDIEGNGKLIDLKDPVNHVNVVFNASTVVGDPGRAVIAASTVSMHPDYQGFGNCPPGVDGFCVNDDVSVLTLERDAPAAAKIYKVSTAPISAGTRIMMAGYGTSGDGIDGYYVAPAFRVKRVGQNTMDAFDGDDEQSFGGVPELYYADFDGAGIDSFCEWEIFCSEALPNDLEANIGGGDSGGPSFLNLYGEMMLVANNTFGNSAGYTDGAFGSFFGGVILGSYADYLYQASGGQVALVPEPATLLLWLVGLLAITGVHRRAAVARRPVLIGVRHWQIEGRR